MGFFDIFAGKRHGVFVPDSLLKIVSSYSQKTDAATNGLLRDMFRVYLLAEGSTSKTDNVEGFYYQEGIEYIPLDVFEDNLEAITKFHITGDELKKMRQGLFMPATPRLHSAFLEISANRGLHPFGSYAQAMRLYSAVLELGLRDEKIFVKFEGEFETVNISHLQRINLDNASTWDYKA